MEEEGTEDADAVECLESWWWGMWWLRNRLRSCKVPCLWCFSVGGSPGAGVCGGDPWGVAGTVGAFMMNDADRRVKRKREGVEVPEATGLEGWSLLWLLLEGKDIFAWLNVGEGRMMSVALIGSAQGALGT